jgi:hypothetical protein
MSAIDVTSQCSMASLTWPAIVGSKIVTSIGSSSSIERTMSAIRSATGSERNTIITRSMPSTSSARLISSSPGAFSR